MSKEWFAVYTAKNFVEAEMLKSLLESEALHPMLPHEGLPAPWGNANRMAGIAGTTLVVPVAEQERACQLIEAWKRGRDGDKI